MSDRKAMKRQMAKGLSKKLDGNGAITGHAADTASTPYAIIDGKRVAVLHGRVAKTPDGRIHEVFGVDFASAGTQSVMHKGVYECHGNGNAAAMRDALENLTRFPEEDIRALENLAKRAQDSSMYGGGVLLALTCAIREGKKALAAPPRNCDVGTASEQTERWKTFCSAHYRADIEDWQCGCCPCGDEKSSADCEFEWGQMPYEAEGGAK